MPITASAAKKLRKPSAPPKEMFQGDVERVIWACISEMHAIGIRYEKLKPKLDRLRKQTEHPEAYKHPDFPEAMARWMRWHATIRGYEMRGESLRATVAKHWDRLTVERKIALIQSGGWGDIIGAQEVAKHLWREAIGQTHHRQWPGGEPPF